MFTSIVSTHNFADDNNSNNLTINVDCLKLIFESECKVAIKWFHKNKLIINPAIQAIKYLISVINTDGKFIIGSEEIQVVSSVDIPEIKTDDKLNFNLYIDKTCLN